MKSLIVEKAKLCSVPLTYRPNVHVLEVPMPSGVYWARAWEGPEGQLYICPDLNGEMIEMAEPGVFLDIGANLGRYTIPMATKATKVFAFEPEPENYQDLVQVTKNRPNVYHVPFALSNVKATVEFRVSGQLRGMHSIRSTGGEEQIIKVDTITLDEFLGPMHSDLQITGIKIDVEGHELEVLQGAQKLLKKHNPIIALETHQNINTEEIFHLLDSLGFEIRGSDGFRVWEVLPDCQYLIYRPKKC